MTVKEIQKLLNAKVLACEEKLDLEVTSAFASDMMSDCLAFAKDASVLITGLCNPQVMRTAELLDIGDGSQITVTADDDDHLRFIVRSCEINGFSRIERFE